MGKHKPDTTGNQADTTGGLLRLGVLHYHLRRGGVYTVIANTLRSLIEYGPYQRLHIDLLASDTSGPAGRALVEQLEHAAQRQSGREVSIRPITLPELAYHQEPAASRADLFEQAQRLADRLTQACKLEHSSLERPYVLHTHNANLGKNPSLTLALKLLADRWEEQDMPAWLLYQMHDFAEDDRPTCWAALCHCSGQADLPLATTMMYPTGRRVQWACINSADRENLLAAGLPKEYVTLLPNPVDVETFSAPSLTKMSTRQLCDLGIAPLDFKADLKNRIARFAQQEGFVFEATRKILLAPVKALRRKNVIESILLLELLNHREDQHQLLITLRPDSPEDHAYCRQIEAFVKQHRLPVVIGFGHEILQAGHQRVVTNGRVEAYSLLDMIHLSDAVLTTSVQEGFGYVFHEPWLTGKAVLGRNLPAVTSDFKAAGLSLAHLYEHLLIPRRWLGPLWDELVALYQAKLEAGYESMGLTPPSPADMVAAIESHKGHRTVYPHQAPKEMVDWADLPKNMQLLCLQIIVKDRRLLDAIRPLAANPAQSANWYPGDPHAIIEHNGASIAHQYALPAAAVRFAKLIATGSARLHNSQHRPQHSKVAQVSNEAIFARCLGLDRLHLLA